MKKIVLLGCAGILATTGAALAGHGKAGLWNVTTNMTMANMPQIPPETLAMMKQRGMQMPGMGQPIATQICMTQQEVDSDLPLHMGDREMQCDSHVTSKTASSISADMVCNGRTQGTGHLQVSYSGAQHYAGSYSFKGTSEGHPADMTTSFKGDWVKADCGAVKPFVH
ncbi:MAG TPA: DUF3617 domain-containing protein [Rhizomicrobium sp.]|jgi:hypothetical protein|nr:DUF3617 domain-containing protein [Rhizomicrobium sp.]